MCPSRRWVEWVDKHRKLEWSKRKEETTWTLNKIINHMTSLIESSLVRPYIDY